MASYVFFFLLTLSFSLQIQARESKFFSNTLSPAPSPAPAPESSDVEHGYGLYGRESVTTADVAGEVKYVEAEGLGKKSFRDFVMPNSNGNGWNRNENENEKGHESVSEKQGMSDTRFLENGKYYYDGNNEKNGVGNEKQEMSEYTEENRFPGNEGNGNGNEKQEMSEYMEETRFPENKGNGKEKQDMEDNRFLENAGGPGGDKEKQDMEENRFPENEGNGNEAEKKYLVDGKYYSGYVTKSENGNEKQEMNEYVEDENSFPENKENGNEYETETEKEETGEKRYFVNGKYYSGYVTGSKNRNGNEKQGISEYVEDENSVPENKENVNRYHESEEREMGDKRYFVNGKYYTGYVTKSGSGNENENHGMMSEYVEDENRYPENEGHEENETEKKYLVNGKYYNGYVTKSGYGDRKNHNYDNYEDSGANGHNESEFYDGDNEYVREGQEQEYGERQNEYAP